MKKRFFIILIICHFIPSITSGQGLSHIPASFLDIGFGGRALGMGGACIASSDDIYSLTWNPAGLTSTIGFQGTFSYTRQLDIIPYSFAATSGRIDEFWAHGEGVVISGDELMREIRGLVGLARSLYGTISGLSVGTTLELRYATFGKEQKRVEGAIAGEAYGLALNLGAQYRYSKHLVLAVKIQDMLSVLNWSTTGYGSYFENTPFSIYCGIAGQKINNFNIETDLRVSIFRDVPQRIYLGVERPLFHYFIFRGGYAQNLTGREPNLLYTLGLGFQNIWQDRIKLDFAYLIHDIQNYYRISIVFQR
ncbi:hypothetical protein JW964_21295 [candidate division KSB1 bacterium]|nr:hypothetical protein [candidate division KSB1 bacterium]